MLCLAIEGELLVRDEDGREEVIGVDGLDAVIFSDTGAEWAHTYAQVKPIKRLAARHGFRFLVLRKPRKTGPLGWLRNQRASGDRSDPVWVARGGGMSIEEKAASGAYHRRLPIMPEFSRFAKIAVTVNASCTDNHKVGPIRRVIEDLSRERFGVGNRSWGHGVRKGARLKHRVLLGIAADESHRAIKTGRPSYEDPIYPLLDMGITKAGEAPILARHGFGAVRKSGCFMCPYQPVGWYWALRETQPTKWAEVVEYERKALAANPKMFLTGSRPISEVVDRWRFRNPRATVDDVLDKNYARGGCKVPVTQLPLFQTEAA